MNDQEQKQIFSYNLIQYLQRSGKTQREAADAIGVSPQTFNTWCKGIALPRMGKVQRLADYFQISKTDLLDLHDFSSVISSDASNVLICIPVYEQLTEHDSGVGFDSPIYFEHICKEVDDRVDYLGIRVTDSSMEPRLMVGDTVILKRQENVSNNDLFAILWNHQTLIRRIKPYEDGLMLLASNPTFDPIIVSQSQLQNKTVQIVGRVIEMRVKF